MGQFARVFLLLSCIFLFGVSYFPARLPAKSSPLISSAFIVFIALPSFYYLGSWLGLNRAGVILLIFSILSIIVEGVAVVTGFPYGGFSYPETLGYKVLGLVPWSVPLAYVPFLLGSATLASQLFDSSWLRFGFGSSIILLAVDLVVDPAAVSAGLWAYTNAGAYFGVPLNNFMGWLLTGFVYSVLFLVLLKPEVGKYDTIPMEVSTSLVMALSFWTGFLIWRSLVAPAFIGIIQLALYGRILLKTKSFANPS
jgi:putative membrane protein